jgi:hypothetical protein
MPRLLELALECEEYQSLPYSGGVMEQPAGLLRKMRQVNNVYQTFKVYQQEGNRPGETAKWKREHEDMWNIVSQVEKLRTKYG